MSALGASATGSPVTFLVPGDVAAPTGGNQWDRAVREALVDRGVPLRWRPVDGAWPVPPGGAGPLLDALAEAPDGSAVVVDGLLCQAWPDALAAHTERVRLVVVVHLPLALEHGSPAAADPHVVGTEARALRLADVVVATSHWCAGWLARHEGVHAVVVQPAVGDVPPVTARSGPGLRVLAVGALTPRKAHDVLLEALAHRAVPAGARVRVVGPDPSRAPACPPAVAAHVRRLRERARSAALPVDLVGPLRGEALEAEWQAADLLVLPSRWETFGMVVTEALARDLPCVVTGGSGAVEALDGPEPGAGPRAGLVVPPGSPVALAAALQRWWQDEQLRARLREGAAWRGRQVRADGWDRAAAQLETVLAGVSA